MEGRSAPYDQWTEHILRSAVVAGETLTRFEGTEAALSEVLAALGGTTGVSRACVWRNVTLPDGGLAMDMHVEWTAPGVAPVIEDEANHNWPYKDGYTRYQDLLSKGEIMAGPVSEFPPNERTDLEAEGIASAAFVPLFVGGEWWGFLAFDDCEVERHWPALSLEALRVIASILSSAFLRDELAAERRKAEDVMRSHIESIPAITYMEAADPDHPLGYDEYYISPQVETILGYTEGEWLHELDPDTWWELIHPDDRGPLKEVSEHSNETGEDYSIEYRMRHKDGHWVWLNDECKLVSGVEGEAPYWHGVMMDITEQKQAEDKLREAEKQFETLVNNLPAVVYIDDPKKDYETIYISPQVKDVAGFTPEEWMADNDIWDTHVHPDDKDQPGDFHLRDDVVVEYRFIRPDGRTVWISEQSRPVFDAAGEVEYELGVMLDITERKLADEEREFQSRLLQSISDAVVAYDRDMIVTSWNRAAQVLYGWTSEEAVGQPLPASLRYDPRLIRAIWDPFVEEMHGWRGTTIHEDKDGYQISVETKGLPLLDAGGNVVGHVTVNRESAEH